MDASVYRSSGSKVVVSAKDTMLFNFLGNGGRILAETFGDIFHGHVLVKTFFDKNPIVKN